MMAAAESWSLITECSANTVMRIEALKHVGVKKQRELEALPIAQFYRTPYWILCQRAKRYAVNFTCERCGVRLVPLRVRVLTWQNHGNEGANLRDLSALCEKCGGTEERALPDRRGLHLVG